MLFARHAMQNKILYDHYAATVKPGERAFNKAFADAYHPPKINSIALNDYRGQKGDRIAIDASDNFKVVRIRVALVDEHNNVIEKGCARKYASGNKWSYKAKRDIADLSDLHVRVTAFDLAGNRKTIRKSINPT